MQTKVGSVQLSIKSLEDLKNQVIAASGVYKDTFDDNYVIKVTKNTADGAKVTEVAEGETYVVAITTKVSFEKQYIINSSNANMISSDTKTKINTTDNKIVYGNGLSVTNEGANFCVKSDVTHTGYITIKSTGSRASDSDATKYASLKAVVANADFSNIRTLGTSEDYTTSTKTVTAVEKALVSAGEIVYLGRYGNKTLTVDSITITESYQKVKAASIKVDGVEKLGATKYLEASTADQLAAAAAEEVSFEDDYFATVYQAGTTTKVTGELVAGASYDVALKSPADVTVTYKNKNGEDATTIAPVTVKEGKTTKAVKMSEDNKAELDRDSEGYKFIGWSTSAGATVATYAPDATITVTADMVLYPVYDFKDVKLTVQSAYNGIKYEQITNVNVVGKYGQIIPTPAAPTADFGEDFEFKYWSLHADGKDAEGKQSKIDFTADTFTENTNIFAIYGYKTYKLTVFNAKNAGMAKSVSVNVISGTTLKAALIDVDYAVTGKKASFYSDAAKTSALTDELLESTLVRANKEIYVDYADASTFTVKVYYKTASGSAAYKDYTVTDGDMIGQHLGADIKSDVEITSEKTKYVFADALLDEDNNDISLTDKITGPATYTIKYKIAYLVECTGDSKVFSDYVVKGEKIVLSPSASAGVKSWKTSDNTVFDVNEDVVNSPLELTAVFNSIRFGEVASQATVTLYENNVKVDGAATKSTRAYVDKVYKLVVKAVAAGDYTVKVNGTAVSIKTPYTGDNDTEKQSETTTSISNGDFREITLESIDSDIIVEYAASSRAGNITRVNAAELTPIASDAYMYNANMEESGDLSGKANVYSGGKFIFVGKASTRTNASIAAKKPENNSQYGTGNAIEFKGDGTTVSANVVTAASAEYKNYLSMNGSFGDSQHGDFDNYPYVQFKIAQRSNVRVWYTGNGSKDRYLGYRQLNDDGSVKGAEAENKGVNRVNDAAKATSNSQGVISEITLDAGVYQFSGQNSGIRIYQLFVYPVGTKPVEAIDPTSVELSKTSHTFNTLGDTIKLTATVKPDNATNRNVNWSVTAGDAVTVSENGLVTAVKNGTATVTATAAGKSSVKADCTITVSAGNTEDLTADKKTLADSISLAEAYLAELQAAGKTEIAATLSTAITTAKTALNDANATSASLQAATAALDAARKAAKDAADKTDSNPGDKEPTNPVNPENPGNDPTNPDGQQETGNTDNTDNANTPVPATRDERVAAITAEQREAAAKSVNTTEVVLSKEEVAQVQEEYVKAANVAFDKKNASETKVETLQAANDQGTVLVTYKKGKAAKVEVTSLNGGEIDVTVNAKTKVTLPSDKIDGVNYKVVSCTSSKFAKDKVAKAIKWDKKAGAFVLTTKDTKYKNEKGYVIVLQGTNGIKVTLHVVNVEIDKVYKKYSLSSVDSLNTPAQGITVTPYNGGSNGAMLSGAWQIGKDTIKNIGEKQTVQVSKTLSVDVIANENGTITIFNPTENAKGNIKITYSLNGVQYKSSVKVINKSAKDGKVADKNAAATAVKR